MSLESISYENFMFSLENDENNKPEVKKEEPKKEENSNKSHMIAAKKAQKRNLWDDLKDLPGKVTHLQKKFKVWSLDQKKLFFYRRYLDRVQSGLYDKYAGEARVKENVMKDDPVMILKGPAREYIKDIIDGVNNIYETVLNMSKALESKTTAEGAINVVKEYCSEYIGHNSFGFKKDQDKMKWSEKILNATRYKIAKVLTQNGEHQIYGYTTKNMVLKGYPKPNHLIVSLFVDNPEQHPELQYVNNIFRSADSFEIIGRADKQEVFNIANISKVVLEKTVSNKVINTVKEHKAIALNAFKRAKMPNKIDEGKIIDSIWEGINLSCKHLLGRKRYIIDCINIYFDMIIRIDNLAIRSIKELLNVENTYLDTRYKRSLNVKHKRGYYHDEEHRYVSTDEVKEGSLNDKLANRYEKTKNHNKMVNMARKLNRGEPVD